MAEAVGVGDCFDFDNFSVCDGEAKHHEEASAWGHDNSDFAVDERRLCCSGTAPGCAVGYGCCAADRDKERQYGTTYEKHCDDLS